MNNQINNLIFSFNKLTKKYGQTPNLQEKILFDSGLIAYIEELISPYGQSPIIIVDNNTKALLPVDSLKKKNIFILSANATPLLQIADKLSAATQEYDLIVGVGSGTLNDICKYSAFKTEKPYVIFPSAMSMNGYTSQFSSMFDKDGMKKSFATRLPEAIFIDSDVLATAPLRLNISGLFDFLCRSFVRTDLLISSFVKGTNFDNTPFKETKDMESELIRIAPHFLNRDKEALKLLTEASLLSGLYMSFYGSSRTSSQSEHMLCHIFEHFSKHRMLHGESVGIALLITSVLQENLLSARPLILPNTGILYDAENFFKNFGFYNVYRESKTIDKESADKINSAMRWQELSDAVNCDRLPSNAIKSLFSYFNYSDGSVPGIERDILKQILKYAFITRDRFTILDLLHTL